ncbi:GNAT family N-acetyltransferase, cg3035/Rv0428c family [Gordonia shandongensis]|uniref:GNAT family N-acetyltransferase, cg3035/Rv0428c family n=1 Tax=Gordonia shandongensis TaxID=376351 RepID=UPI00054D4F16|nr:hypothetical protein [Gordonia shandongensis]
MSAPRPPASSPRPAVGDRVVVRYRLGEGAPADWRSAPNPPLAGSPTMSDITGVLREVSDSGLVVERDGLHRIAREAVVTVRLLSRRVVRNSEIREVERALMAAAPAADRDVVDGWMVNGAGAALRSAVCSPIEFGSTAAGLPAALARLRDLGVPGRVWVADRLLRPSSLGIGGTVDTFEVLVGPAPDSHAPVTDETDLRATVIAEGVAAVTVPITADTAGGTDEARLAWRAAGFELHHTGSLLTP